MCEQSAHNPDYVKYLRTNKFTDYPFNPVVRGGVRQESRCVGHRPPGRLRDSGARLTSRPEHPASTSSRTAAPHSAHGLTPVAGPLSSTAAGRSRLPVLQSGKPSRKTARLRSMAFFHTGRPPASLKPGSERIPLSERPYSSKVPVKGRSGISPTGSPDGLPETCAKFTPPHQRHHPSTVPRHASDSASCVIVPTPLRPAQGPEVHRLHSLAVARAALAHCVPSLAIGLGSVPPATHIRSAPLQRQYMRNPHWPGLRPSQRGERNFNTHKRLQPAKPSADTHTKQKSSSSHHRSSTPASSLSLLSEIFYHHIIN